MIIVSAFDEMIEKMLRGFLCFRIDDPENHTPFGLSIQNNGARGRGNNQRNYREIFFSIYYDRCGSVSKCMVECVDQFIRQRSCGVLHLNTFSPDCGKPAARRAHGKAIHDCNRRSNAVFLEIMGDNISNRVDRETVELRDNFFDRTVKFTKWLHEEPAVLFGKDKHLADLQRVTSG